MSYVDAILDTKKDRIHVVERAADGSRQYRDYPANYVLYYPDRKGKQRTLFGDPVSKFSTNKKEEFEKERRMYSGKQLFESDVNPVFRCLSDNYLGIDPPKLHTCFFDIEVDWKPAEIPETAKVLVRSTSDREVTSETTVKDIRKLRDKFSTEVWDARLNDWVAVAHSTFMVMGEQAGFSPTSDPFNPVTAISCYLDWLDQCITLVIAPKHMPKSKAQEIVSSFENTILFDSEKEMFDTFFLLIEDADVLTGWNSEGYDIPYMVNRVTRVMSKDDTRKFCLLGQYPKTRKYERFGKEETTFDLVGRVHLDYLQLYKKYNYESRHSYKLDAIGELEVGENKTQYEGNLDQLYNRDFKKFIQYNRQDTMLLVKIHNKLKFLDLANALAHENTVTLPTVMGSVAMIEMAIYNEAHARGLVVPDKKRKDHSEESTPAAGAYVANPKKGLHQWVGAVDINSLYPSVIRALNMAPETIAAQLRPDLTEAFLKKRGLELGAAKARAKEGDEVTGAALWEGLFGSLEYTAVMEQKRDVLLWVDFEDGRSEQHSAAEVYRMVFESHRPWILSANGTIFTLEKEGVIPGLLSRWYKERKETQALAKKVLSVPDSIQLDPALAQQVAALLNGD